MTKKKKKKKDAEYEKRKKRVTATYRMLGFGLAHGGGSTVLAAIIYDGTLLNIASERFLKDIGASPRDNATLYSGRAKQFATDMSMPIDIPYTLGSDIFASRGTFTSPPLTQTAITDGYNYVHDGTSGTAECFANLSPAIQDGDTVVHTFDAVVNSGTVTLLDGQTITTGSNTIIATNALSGGDRSYFRYVDAVAFDFDIINETAQKATATAKHLYKFDHDTDTFVYDELTDDQIQYHLGRVNGYSDGAYENKTYGLVNVFTDELSTADFNLMTSEPEALVNMVANDIADTRFTVTKSDCRVCMTLTEDGSFCRNYAEDLGSEEVTNGGFDTDTDWVKGSGSTISGGTLNIVSASYNATTRQAISIEVGKSYLITYDTVAVGATGNNTFYIGFGDSGGNPTTYTPYEFVAGSLSIREIFTAVSGDETFVIRARDAGSSDLTIDNVSIKEIDVSEIQNYTTLPDPDIRALNTRLQTTPFKLDSIGMIDGVGDGIEMHGAEKAVTPTRTKTADITIEITPNTVESILLVDTTIGDITMNANGTVTASSGSVDIDTTTLQAGVKSILTVTGISIDGVSTLFSDLDGTIHNYNEDTA